MLEQKTILLVEDEVILAIDETLKLKQFGYLVITAYSGEEAVQIVSDNENISLVLIDIYLGEGMSGTEAAQKIIEMRNVPIVFLTSHSERDFVEKVRGIARYGYVLKNSGDFVLESTIEMALELFEANLQRAEESEIRRNNTLRAIHEYSLELAYLPYEEMFPNIIKKVKAIFNVKGALINLYDENTSDLIVKYSTFSDSENSTIIMQLGKKLIGYRIHIEKEHYRMMTTEIVGRLSSLHDLSFGSIPVLIGKSLEKLFGVEWFVPIALIHKEKLVGTMVLVGGAGLECPGREEMLTFAGITSNALGRKQAEESLRESEARFRLIIENLKNIIFLLDRKGAVTYISPSIRHYGYECEDLLGHKIIELVYPDNRAMAEETFARLLENDEDACIELKLIRKDGEIIWALMQAHVLRDEAGAIVQFVVILEDFTENKKAMDALRTSEEHYRLLADNSSDVVWTMDLNGRFTYISPSVQKMTGWSQEEAISMAPEDYMLPEYARLIREEIARELMKPITERLTYKIFEIKQYAKDGAIIDDEITATWIYNEKGETVGIQGSNRYITERKQAEETILNLLLEKELLLKEVHHRIKNNMSTMISLLSLQSIASQDSTTIAALNAAKSRMISMGVLYDKLYRSKNLKDMSIKEYLPPLIDEIISNFPNKSLVKIDKKIDDFVLNIKILSSLGIIVNELITNSMKHAFTGRENGLITVSASIKSKSACLIIEDNGTGIPKSMNIEAQAGFGLKLVGMMLKQIGCSMKIERSLGTRFVIEFKV